MDSERVEFEHPAIGVPEENVQIQHVSTCWRCEDAFKSVYDAALTIFQQKLG